MTLAVFKKTCIKPGHMSLYGNKLAPLIANVLANRKPHKEAETFCLQRIPALVLMY